MEFFYSGLSMVLGAWLGAYFGHYYATRLAQRQKAEQEVASADALLRCLLDQLKYNRGLLLVLKPHLDGPSIRNLWSPAAAHAAYLQLDGWGTLVRAGVLPLLTVEHRHLLYEAEHLTRLASQTIQVYEAKWRRAWDWDDHDRLNRAPQRLNAPELAKDQWLGDARTITRQAIEQIDKAIEVIPVIMEDLSRREHPKR